MCRQSFGRGGGDSNGAFDQGLDKSKPPSAQLTRPTRVSLKIAKLLHDRGLTDVWRESNPFKRDFTHYSYPHKTYARIDHILVPSYVVLAVIKSQIRDTVLSEHSIVIMFIRTMVGMAKRGHWQ